MLIDILIIVFLLLLVIFGYLKGFITGLVNLVFWIAYLLLATKVLNFSLAAFNNQQLSLEAENNAIFKYLLIIVIGLILMLIINLIIRKLVKKKLISGFNRLGGMIIYFLVGYLIVCIANVIFSSITPFISLAPTIKDSYFLSQSFHDYNFIYWWWLNG